MSTIPMLVILLLAIPRLAIFNWLNIC
jgi:hypothetical protein